MPGKFIQGFKQLKSGNPVIVIDEIDKVGSGWRGDPSAALLEVLDPKQNFEFQDHYLDVPYDLSKSLFICTANVLDTIPGPLLDRMEVISLSGYVLKEKMEIAKRYLIPKTLKECGLTEKQIKITESALQALIRDYCREAGVRNLEKMIEKICRKVTFKLVQGAQKQNNGNEEPVEQHKTPDQVAGVDTGSVVDPVLQNFKAEMDITKDTEVDAEDTEVDTRDTKMDTEDVPVDPNKHNLSFINLDSCRRVTITSKNLSKYVGKPIFTTERYYDKPIPGVVMGLVYTSMGGGHTYIETIINPVSKAEQFTTTGKIGEVMKESTDIALTYAKNFYQTVCEEKDKDFFLKNSLHMHVPEGGTPKEGPSAGITMVTSLLSLALGKSVHPDIAMTGEITLTGKVLKIGGVKEKTMGAKRAGVKFVIFPKDNQRDFEELPEHISSGVTPFYAEYYKDVYNAVFNYQPKQLEKEAKKKRGGKAKKPEGEKIEDPLPQVPKNVPMETN